MMKKNITIILAICFSHIISAQIFPDSIQTLQEVSIKAFEQNRKLLEVSAPVVTISNQQLNRFSNTNILPALNSAPGIRMEERSPGSYRMNIRGSSLRSPFGVRNVKTYFNNIPYTDPGGNTYLNQLGFYNMQSLELIKGPGSSLYGAGTGGVMLINSTQTNWATGLDFDVSTGNYGLLNLNTNLRLGTDSFRNKINYLQLSSNGYRDHTELDRKVFTWEIDASLSEKQTISTHFIWGDLFYQTPGGLTLTQYNNNPKSARPRAGQIPGSEENKAAIYQELFFAGISFKQKFNDRWQNITSFYGAATRVKNPSIRNYERRNEPHTGGRSLFQYSGNLGTASKINLVAGIEFQQGLSTVRVYGNKSGAPDTLQTDDEINNRAFFVFTQASIELPKNWILTTGASFNTHQVSVTRFSRIPVTEQQRKYKNVLAPRLSILKKFNESHTVYTSISRGFSPPTTSEILPSTGVISTDLNAEHGYNYEIGFRGKLHKSKIFYDVNAFYFGLKNTIVQRRDQAGADFFVNAGSTNQKGIETYISWFILNKLHQPVNHLKFWLSHTWYNFSYKEFKQLNNDFSGNKLPSVATHVLVAGLDVKSKPGVYMNITYYYSDPVPLNDANTEFASSFNLLGTRIGWKKNLHPKVLLELFLSADNIFDIKYSLGNDINAIGGRYYNAAAGFNISGGISLHFNFR